jgi:hypothetical protein
MKAFNNTLSISILLLALLSNRVNLIAQDKYRFEFGIQYSSNFGQTGFSNNGGNLQFTWAKDRNLGFGIQSFFSVIPTSITYQINYVPFYISLSLLPPPPTTKTSYTFQQYHGAFVQYKFLPFFFFNFNIIVGLNYGGTGNIGLIDKLDPAAKMPLGDLSENEISQNSYNKLNSLFVTEANLVPMLAIAIDWKLGGRFAFRFQATNYDISQTSKNDFRLYNNFEILVDDENNLVLTKYDRITYFPLEFSAGLLFKIGKKKY